MQLSEKQTALESGTSAVRAHRAVPRWAAHARILTNTNVSLLTALG